MTPAEAAWVYTTVFTERYLNAVGAIAYTGAGPTRRDEGQGAAFLALCPCQWGACGYCALLGKHDRCTSHGRGRTVAKAAAIVSREGYWRADVWPTGAPCSWRCPCGCAPEVLPIAAPEPEPVFAVEQLELFALAGGAR